MVMQIIPTPYVGKGLLDDDDRNNILSQFAGGLLQGYNVNPTPVMGQYFTPIGGGAPMVTGGMQDQATQLTPDEFARMMQEYRNEQNLLNEGGSQDDFDFAPAGADPGFYDGNLFEFLADPKGFFSLANVPGISPFGTIKGLIDSLRTGRSYQDLARGQYLAYDTEADDLEDAMGLTGGDVNDPAAMESDPSFDMGGPTDMGDFEF